MVPMIEIVDYSFTYDGSERPALEGLNLLVDEGEFVVLAGPSGCGKSTLALAMGGYLGPQFKGRSQGALRIGGLAVDGPSLYEIADVVGLVQQNPENQFCTLTVADEIAFGLENRCLAPALIQERIAWALRVVRAEPLRDRPLATLSGGEKQKVAIASMLVAQPRVLIFDEPTSNLDPSATAAIFEVLEGIRQESAITIVVIEHKLGYLRRFEPRLVRMEAGRIVDDRARIPPDSPVQARQSALPGQPLMAVERLSYDYGGLRALDQVNATLHAGQLVALMGDNGSGKTTFLGCLMGLLRPATGRVQVLGRDTRELQVSALVRDAGYLFQNPDHQLLTNSVAEEATLIGRNLGMLERVVSRADRLLEEVGLAQRRADHPFRLSYGEKRRLNLVSVAAHEPLIVLADEVLIGQDPDNAAYLMAWLRRLADAGGCVVLALHHPQSALAYADRVLFFAAGRVVVDATPHQALEELVRRGHAAYGVS